MKFLKTDRNVYTAHVPLTYHKGTTWQKYRCLPYLKHLNRNAIMELKIETKMSTMPRLK